MVSQLILVFIIYLYSLINIFSIPINIIIEISFNFRGKMLFFLLEKTSIFNFKKKKKKNAKFKFHTDEKNQRQKTKFWNKI